MARQITLNDRERIEIVNAEGEVTGEFWWNPSDLDIVKRCEKVIEFFNNISVPEENSGEDALFALSDAIKEQFDYLISPGASDTLFKYCNPLSPREDGTLFAEYVLEVLIRFVEQEMDVRMERTTFRIRKYTEKYRE